MYKVDLYARVRYACHVEGKSIREAARVFGLHRSTVRKMLRYRCATRQISRGIGGPDIPGTGRDCHRLGCQR